MSFPQELKALKQWVSWHTEQRNGKKTKVLLQGSGAYAKSNDPATWDSYENVKKRKHGGIGFVFVNGVVGIDLDYAFYTTGEKKGQLKDWARKAVDGFNSYTEFSPTRINGIPKGLHIIVKCGATFDGVHHSRTVEERTEKEVPEQIEVYMSGRFFTVTEEVFENRTELKEIEAERMVKWVEMLRRKKDKPVVSPYTGVLPPDADILARIRSSRNSVKFTALYDLGDWKSLGFGSQSEADLSLAGSLMFFCRNDIATADRLFKGSRLYRTKWDERHGKDTYGMMTLERAKRVEMMNWLDPTCDDPDDMLKSIRLFGSIGVEKTDIGYIVRAPLPEGVAVFNFTELSTSRASTETVLRVHVEQPNNEPSSPFTLRIDIKSGSAQRNLVTDLNKALGKERNWSLITNNAFSALIERLATEEKPISGINFDYAEPRFLLYPFLQERATNMIFSQPETGKSWLALRMAVCLSSGVPLFGYQTASNHRTLYLDYEDNAQVFFSRLHSMCAGMGLDYKSVAENILYLNPTGSVRDTVENLRKTITEEKISLAVFDAGGDAAGGSPNDEQKVIDLFNALQTLPCTRLMLHHEPKSVDGVSNENSYYGTMYWRGRSRVAWRLIKKESGNNKTMVEMALSKKSNLGHIPPIFYTMEIEDKEMARFVGHAYPHCIFELTSPPEKPEEGSPASVLQAIGADGATSTQIGQIVGISQRHVRRVLFELKSQNKILEKKEGRLVMYYKNTAQQGRSYQ